MAKIEETIETLKLKLQQAKARKQKSDARKKLQERKTTHANDTRKKILLGAYMLDRMGKNEAAKLKMISQLDEYLTRADDRELFGLSPLPAAPAVEPAQT
ncbi:hypothetical protein [Polaromonas naphthalenivorans]|uniref:Mobilization protein n=1 Tax=Polaromonas naphthalenivorans (strain CJ2) TaxID=365044 RepID=A1VX67_POLNA|nr:hypothetical protein [Polaromonas naphthalenivorans]ABM40245.1 hypothetical protein Pnap_4997 [Polaromonas naphthalenivorans CJ2]